MSVRMFTFIGVSLVLSMSGAELEARHASRSRDVSVERRSSRAMGSYQYSYNSTRTRQRAYETEEQSQRRRRRNNRGRNRDRNQRHDYLTKVGFDQFLTGYYDYMNTAGSMGYWDLLWGSSTYTVPPWRRNYMNYYGYNVTNPWAAYDYLGTSTYTVPFSNTRYPTGLGSWGYGTYY